MIRVAINPKPWKAIKIMVLKEKSLKSGCRFYVREDRNFKVALVVKLKLVFTD